MRRDPSGRSSRTGGRDRGRCSPLVPGGDPARTLQHLYDRAATAVACDSLGLAEAMLDTTVAYVGVREQFGRRIGSFQAVKHACADMLVAITVSRRLVAGAVRALVDDAPDAAVAVSMAKSHVCAAAVDVAGKAVQLHGGMGYTWESGIHVYLKRATLNRSLFGSPPGQHRRRLAERYVIAGGRDGRVPEVMRRSGATRHAGAGAELWVSTPLCISYSSSTRSSRARSWVTITIARSRSWASPASNPTISRLRASSSADVGSSTSSTDGSFIRLRAIATRCLCPPDNWWGSLVEMTVQSERGQQVAGPIAMVANPAATQMRRHQQLVHGSERREQIGLLEHETELLAAERGALGPTQSGGVGPVDGDGAEVGGGGQQARHCEQTRLARSGRARDRGQFTAADGEAHVSSTRSTPSPSGVGQDCVVESDAHGRLISVGCRVSGVGACQRAAPSAREGPRWRRGSLRRLLRACPARRTRRTAPTCPPP